VSIITEKADQRMELTARVAAETAVRVLFEKMLKCVCRYQQKADQVELLGQWLDIDPREWVDAFNIHINVGLGTGQGQEAQILQARSTRCRRRWCRVGRFRRKPRSWPRVRSLSLRALTAPETYFPDQMQHPPQPGPMEVEQMKAQAKAQVDMQSKQAELQVERERMQMQAQVDTNRQQVEAQQQQLKAASEMEMERFKFGQQMQLEREKAQMQAQLQIELARINADAKIAAAEVTSKSTLTAQQDAAAQNASQ
jgi:hypothetical protein